MCLFMCVFLVVLLCIPGRLGNSGVQSLAVGHHLNMALLVNLSFSSPVMNAAYISSRRLATSWFSVPVKLYASLASSVSVYLHMYAAGCFAVSSMWVRASLMLNLLKSCTCFFIGFLCCSLMYTWAFGENPDV